MQGVKVLVNASVARNLYALLCGVAAAMAVIILVHIHKGDGFLRQFGEFVDYLNFQAQMPRIY